MKKYFATLFAFLMLSGCLHKEESFLARRSSAQKPSLREQLKKIVGHSAILEPVWQHIEDEDFEQASVSINLALQSDPENAVFHLLNGFIYEELSRRGNGNAVELANIAYRSAYNLDPSQWLSAFLFGLSEMREGRHLEAQKALTDALILRPSDPDTMYALGYASYYLGDVSLASTMMQKALSCRPKDRRFLRGMIILSASCGHFQKARHFLKLYQTEGADKSLLAFLESRVQDWERIHRAQIVPMSLDENSPGFDSMPPDPGSDPNQKPKENEEKAEDITSIILDCYFLQYSQTKTTLKGQNILNLLKVTLSGDASVSRDLSRSSASRDVRGSWSKAFSLAVSAPTVAYSLNIANAASKTTTILSRPSIHTLLNKPAELISGDSYTGGTGGSSGASVASIDAGISVQVVPTSLTPEGVVTLEITCKGSYFEDNPKTTDGFASQLMSVVQSKIVTTSKALLGQTVVLGGIYHKETSSNEDRTPFFGDLPILQYLFAHQQTTSRVNSVIYLATPRAAGSGKNLSTHDRKIFEATKKEAHQKLKNRGLMSLGEYPSIYYILERLAMSDGFINFRSGDLEKPNNGYELSTLEERLGSLAQFLYF